MKDIQFIDKDLFAPQDSWDRLSMTEKADMIKAAVKNGIYNLKDIRAKYNEFAEGGSTDADLVDRIIMEEGNLSKPTNIGDGKITLGSGLTAQKWHDLYKKRGNKWSAADNRRAVAEEVASRRKWAEKNIPNWDTLPENSQKALLSYKYNYDFNRANSPKLFKALETGNLQEAARQIDATSKDPKFRKGLQARRQREQKWFLSGITPTPTAPTIPFEQPVSTAIFNPYIQQAENTRVAPVMVPDEDSYVTAHRLTEAEERKQRFQERMEAINNFNRLMQMTGVENTAVPAFMPTTGNTFLDSMMGLTKAEGGKIHIKPENRGKFTRLKERTGHSATWFKEHGTPAQKKMATFALNARHWEHGEGGNLYPGGGFMGLMPIFVPAALRGIGNAVKERAYKTITPQSYNISKAAKEFISGKERNLNGIEPVRNEEWARYLGVPYEGESNFEPSPYRPTKGQTYDTVLRFKDESKILSDEVLNQMLKRQKKTGKNSFLVTGNGGGLGSYTLSLGEDGKGKYISYYDDWDINPFKGINARTKIPFVSTIEDIVPGSNPFTVYGRRYYEKTNSKKHNFGGNLFSGEEELI